MTTEDEEKLLQLKTRHEDKNVFSCLRQKVASEAARTLQE